MTLAYVFPGQGSQYVGMGEGLFERFPQLVEAADECLGYSIRELCLKDPQGLLNQTQFTQPALYTINALSHLAKVEDESLVPGFLAGHSLGEFSALFAAGAYDFVTGLNIVRKRGQLMSQANKGAMAAVLGIDITRLREMLERFDMAAIEIANINSPVQTIISGGEAEIEASQALLEKAGVKTIRINVSAAFHSSLMVAAREEFRMFLEDIQFQLLTIPVVSNVTARPYPIEGYKSYLVDQITGAVNWYESVSWLLHRGIERIEEVGPGMVLTNLVQAIRQKPMAITDSGQPLFSATSPRIPVSGQRKLHKNVVFMYGGQGSHYRAMGKELYEKNNTFMREMNRCNRIVEEMTGLSIVQELYSHKEANPEFNDIRITHPAIFSFGYCLTKVLLEYGIEPTAVLGYSLGEYVAATIAGTVSLEDGLKLVIEQAQLLAKQSVAGGMMAVLADVEDIHDHSEDYENCHLGAINYSENFILSGERHVLLETRQRLLKRNITSVLLPVAHAFHSQAIDPIQDSFQSCMDEIDIARPTLDIYSSSRGNRVEAVDSEYFWKAVREPVDFISLMRKLKAQCEYQYVDLSATASLAAFLDRAFGRDGSHHYAVNQFGKNLESINHLLAEMN